jgi:hypothetical protein
VSEQGWHGFLAAEGVDDWVVLYGGATAVFRVGSLSEAARLAEAVAKAPGIAGAGVPQRRGATLKVVFLTALCTLRVCWQAFLG